MLPKHKRGGCQDIGVMFKKIVKKGESFAMWFILVLFVKMGLYILIPLLKWHSQNLKPKMYHVTNIWIYYAC